MARMCWVTSTDSLTNVNASDASRTVSDALSGFAALLHPLVRAFEERELPLYLVGGPVRDALLGQMAKTHDLDFTTPARPDVIADILRQWSPTVWDTGIEYGTVSAERRGLQVEITTFRSDTYDGQSRNPEVRFGDSLEGDLVRRDFRINAMAVQLRTDGSGLRGEFHDPLGGLADLRRGVIDTPSTPKISFGDDPLRMMRAARFISQLGLAVSPQVASGMAEMAEHIDRITVERIRTELDKLMLGLYPEAGWDLLVESGIADRVFPEVPGLRLTQDEHMQHKDVYRHSMTVLRQAMDQEEEPDLVLRWAALLHDCGKPATRAAKPGGGVTFHHHEVVGAKLTRKRLRALKYPKQQIADISQLVYLHMRFHGFSDGTWTDSAVRRYVTDAGPLLPRLHKLVRADCTTRNKKKAARLQRNYDHLLERIDEIQQKEDLAKVRPDLDGNEIMGILGIKPGPEVGKAWAFLKELRLEAGPLGREEATKRLLDWWKGQQ